MSSPEPEDERGYCGLCYRNLNDDEYDYRFDEPVCLTCGKNIPDVEDGENNEV